MLELNLVRERWVKGHDLAAGPPIVSNEQNMLFQTDLDRFWPGIIRRAAPKPLTAVRARCRPTCQCEAVRNDDAVAGGRVTACAGAWAWSIAELVLQHLDAIHLRVWRDHGPLGAIAHDAENTPGHAVMRRQCANTSHTNTNTLPGKQPLVAQGQFDSLRSIIPADLQQIAAGTRQPHGPSGARLRCSARPGAVRTMCQAGVASGTISALNGPILRSYSAATSRA